MKLTKVQKAEIQSSEKSNVELAKEFGVSAAAISKVKNVKKAEVTSNVAMTFTDTEIVITIPKRLVAQNLLASLL